jgi:endonuclease V-like protein UPF0215 family
MPEYQFDMTIEVTVRIIADDEIKAKATVQKEAEETLFVTGTVERNDIPMVSCELIAVDGEDVTMG